MFAHHLKTTIRNLVRQKGISFINIFGLTAGMTCTILIFLWVSQQLRYDAEFANRDQICRLESQTWVVMPPYLSETALAFPEVKEAVRFWFWYEPVLKYKDRQFTLTDFALVDSTLFKVLDFPFIAGNPEEALSVPHSIVLTRSISDKLFGNEDPLGKLILLDTEYEYTVTAVIEDIQDFHLDINGFATVTDITRREGNQDFLTSRNYNFPIYLLLEPNTNTELLAKKIDKRAREMDEYSGDQLILRPFHSIYFANNLQNEKNAKHGNIGLVIAFSIVAVMILVIACFNFINLTLARTSLREKEIAVRKITGASRGMISIQFLGEAFTSVLIAFIVALIMVRILLPGFNSLTGEGIDMIFSHPRLILLAISILVFTSLVSGFYPAFFVASWSPSLILKGKQHKGSRGIIFSKLLITFQFTVSIFLMISAFTVVTQLNYMQTKDLGIDHEQMVTFTLRGDRFRGGLQAVTSTKRAFENELLNNPSILGITYFNQLPGKITNTNTLYLQGNNVGIPYKVINTNPAFFTLMGMKIIEGRAQSFDIITDRNETYVLNEEAVKQFELENPIGSKIRDGRTTIIGVVKDFHFNSLHSKIDPLAIRWNYWPSRACVKIAGNNIKNTLDYIGTVYRIFCPGYNLEYTFLDESFARQYQAEQRIQILIELFVLLAILLSCLGLFALSAIVTKQKTKEIGIRKVLGSSSKGIIMQISKGFLIWVILANLLSWPTAYFILKKWLQGFAYHIEIGGIAFIFSAILALLIAFLTILGHALKASLTNPADSLRYE